MKKLYTAAMLMRQKQTINCGFHLGTPIRGGSILILQEGCRFSLEGVGWCIGALPEGLSALLYFLACFQKAIFNS